MSTLTANRSISAELRYWKRLQRSSVVTDFALPNGEERFNELKNNETNHLVNITDIRGFEHEFNLEQNGFQYMRHEVEGLQRCADESEIAKLLVPQTETMVQKLLEANKVVTFTHRIRCKDFDTAKRADNRAPAHNVHSDFTPAGALKHLESVIANNDERRELLRGRVYVINVWRPLKTVTRDPLAVCDWTSVDHDQDWIANRFLFPDGWHELGAVTHSSRHKWYYLSRQTPSEPLVFKQFDSKRIEDGGMTLAHSAFVDPEFKDAPPRESIEIKMFVFRPS